MSFDQDVKTECGELADFLVKKNEAYGDSALNPIRVFSRLPAEQAILVRIDDKLSRMARGGPVDDEDVIMDLLGYLVLLRIARKQAESTKKEARARR